MHGGTTQIAIMIMMDSSFVSGQYFVMFVFRVTTLGKVYMRVANDQFQYHSRTEELHFKPGVSWLCETLRDAVSLYSDGLYLQVLEKAPLVDTVVSFSSLCLDNQRP